MSFPANHKTVFILDRSPSFFVSSEQTVEFDIFTKSRQPGVIPLAPITKCLWTCAVEAVIEYCRIVWDVHPNGRLVRFVISEDRVKFLNSWNQSEQSLNKLMTFFAELGQPRNVKQEKCSIPKAVTSAIQALCECSEIQEEYKSASDNGNSSAVFNNGRIICITNFRSESQLKQIESGFVRALSEHNEFSAASENLMPLNYCELVIINTGPVNKEPIVSSSPKTKICNGVGSWEVHSVSSAQFLSSKLCHLVLQHYNLASTTVTGIPMKEEQNASSSANYDVELFHPVEAHNELFKMGAAKAEGVPLSIIREGATYPTVTLKWCTPRSNSAELQHCTGVFRVTTVDVNSRPSSCLTNFLLNGRAVMLEMPKKSGAKAMSHILASHGGEIYIHTLGTTSRSILEDPPSISEGCGGRVTDYRIKDFGEFMKLNRAAPLYEIDAVDPPIEKALAQLERQTRYWPMTLSNSPIFNMSSQLQPLLSLIVKEKLTVDEVVECKKVIYKLVHMENKNDPLPVVHVPGLRGKGPKRDEQYRVVWNDLENFIQINASSVDHQSIQECIHECRRPNDSDAKSPAKRIKLDYPEPDSSIMKSAGPVDVKPPLEVPTKKIKSLLDTKGKSGPQSLLSLWTNRINTEHSKRHVEFSGRQKSANNVAKLYPNFSVDVKIEPT